VYLDDIIIFGESEKEHNQRLYQILAKLRDAGVILSKEKCVFGASQVSFLGHLIDKNGIKTDPKKIEQILNWPLPVSIGELVSFLGLANYYRKFVKDFAKITGPLEEAVKRQKKYRSQKIEWSNSMKCSFQTLKTSLTNPPVLGFPSSKGNFILDTDASNNAIGAVLSQLNEEGNEVVIHYASNRLSKRERMYCTTRKELLSVVHYIKLFRPYLLGKRFLLRTDHKSLTWLKTWKNPSTSQYFNWINLLNEYDFEIVHRPGSNHANADAMSRLSSCKQCLFNHEEPSVKLNTISEDCVVTKQRVISILNGATEKEIKKLFLSKPRLSIKTNAVYIKDSENNNRVVLSNKVGQV